jgi:predicted NBD/HSP70 family sugar kinase
METYLGLDLGGTKLLIGEVDPYGNILRYKRYDSGFFNQKSAFDIIKHSLDDYVATVGWVGEKPVSMGVGLIGRVDPNKGIWLQIDPHRTETIALADELTALYGIPCRIDNDVKSATRAERVWGVGQFSKDFVYINVGTGIAVGTVVNGRQIRGSHFNAGEAGHMRVGVNVGIPCVCGRTDCVETIASGMGFDRCARLLRDRYETRLTIPSENGKRVSVEEVVSLSKAGDPLCTVLVQNAAEGIANLIMNMVRVTDPDTVVLGGSIVANEYIFDRIQACLNQNTMRFVTHGVVLTKLNPQFVGLLGAAAVAMNM